MSSPYHYVTTADRDPPSDAMRIDYVKQSAYFVKDCISRGQSKIARVRVVIEFNDGSEVAHEGTP